MQHQPGDNADPQIETDELSPGEARIAKVKAAPRSVFHFGLFSIVWLTIGAAIFMAVPRLWEMEYDDYFMLWYIVLYGCARWRAGQRTPRCRGRPAVGGCPLQRLPSRPSFCRCG